MTFVHILALFHEIVDCYYNFLEMLFVRQMCSKEENVMESK